jgi:hypothetical protein
MKLQCYAEKQALGKASPEFLDTEVNLAVWEISRRMVLKRKQDCEEVSEENLGGFWLRSLVLKRGSKKCEISSLKPLLLSLWKKRKLPTQT